MTTDVPIQTTFTTRRDPLRAALAWIGIMLLAGWAAVIALLLVTLIASLLISPFNEDNFATNAFIPALVICTTVGQMLVLRGILGSAWGWLAAGAVGWSLIYGLVGVLLRPYLPDLGPEVSLTLIGLCVGVVLGITQWAFLRRHFSGAGWWVPASIVGWTLLGLIRSNSLFILGLMPGVLGGAVLAYLLRRNA
jgi:hypothetical protein